MTHYLKTPTYNKQTIKLQLINTIIKNHNLYCKCITPVLHIKKIINTFTYTPCPHTTKNKKDQHRNKKTTNTLKGLKNKKLNHLFAANKKNNKK